MFERLERRLQVLAQEIKAGPKLKPGFFLENGKLGYAPKLAAAEKPVQAAAFDPMTEPLQNGDLVEVVFDCEHTGSRGYVHVKSGYNLLDDTGRAFNAFGLRSSLKLIEKAK
jgi:hypothetical protein